MSTTRARSALITWGVVLFSGVLLVTACTGDPVATGTVPVTSSVVSTVVSSKEITSPVALTPPTLAETVGTGLSNDSAREAVIDDQGHLRVTVPTDPPAAPTARPDSTLEIPRAAQQETVGGASEFLRWWLLLGPASVAAKDLSVYEKFTNSSCASCTATSTRLSALIEADQLVERAENPWSAVLQIDRIDATQIVALVYVEVPPAQIIQRRDGSVVRDSNAFSYTAGIRISWSEDHWLVDDYLEQS